MQTSRTLTPRILQLIATALIVLALLTILAGAPTAGLLLNMLAVLPLGMSVGLGLHPCPSRTDTDHTTPSEPRPVH